MAPTHPLLESACAQTFFLPEPEVAYVPLPVRGLKQYSMMHKEVKGDTPAQPYVCVAPA